MNEIEVGVSLASMQKMMVCDVNEIEVGVSLNCSRRSLAC